MKPPEPSNTSNHPLLPSGLQKFRCYLMCYAGTQEDSFQGEKKLKPRVFLGFVYPEHKREFREGDGPQPYMKTQGYTFSLGKKANLRKDLEGWRGKKYEGDYPDVDITTVLGTAGQQNIIHSESGKSFYPMAFLPIAQDQVKTLDSLGIDAVSYDVRDHDAAAFDKLPKWLQEEVQKSPEWAELHSSTDAAPAAPAAQEAAPAPEEDDDDIPF